MGVCARRDDDLSVGSKRAAFPLLGYLATSCEHRDNYRDFSYGVSHPEHSKSGREAIHLKLDEIIRAIRPADNNMINIEKLSDDELQVLAAQFEKIRAQREPQKKTKSSGGTNRRSHT